MTLTALIAEDEGPQRRAFARLLRTAWPECQIVAECEDGTSAAVALEARRPTVAFLDIRMAGKSGLELAERRSPATQVVFTTAYDQHAVQAFELGAIDYILKPVTAERLAATVTRLRSRLAMPPDVVATQAVPTPAPLRRLSWITAAGGNTVKVLAVRNVLFFQASDRCTRVVSDQGDTFIRTPLYELLEGLDPDAFWQIHRSYIVQIAAIKAVKRDDLGKLEVTLRGSDHVLPVSQSFHHRFRGM